MSGTYRPARSASSTAPARSFSTTPNWPPDCSGPPATDRTRNHPSDKRELIPMSSHREAPEISKDPVADSADLYAFVSPDNPGTVTIIANYVPLQQPAGGPNFYEFGEDVLYEIHIDNDSDSRANVTYQFRFNTVLSDTGPHDLFLYNTGQIKHLSDSTWNRKQFYSITRVDRHGAHLLAKDLACPPCNVGKNSIPSYGSLTAQAIHPIG